MGSSSRRFVVFSIATVAACAPAGPPRPRQTVPVPGAPPSPAPAVDSAAPTPAREATPAASAPAPVEAEKVATPRITSVGQTTWIYRRPEVSEHDYLGYVRSGSSIGARSLETTKGVGCAGGFYEVLPRGFVCSDRTVSAAPPERYVRVASETRPASGPLPYRYALSDGAPMYNRVPTADEIRRTELFQGKPHEFAALFPTLRAHEDLAITEPITATHPLPSFLEQGGGTRREPFDLVERTIPRGAMMSFREAFEAGGRVYLLSTDHTIVPADRVRVFRVSAFHGTALGDGGATLPIAWLRKSPRPKYRALEGGELAATAETWPARSFVELTGKRVALGARTLLETRDDLGGSKAYVLDSDATVVEARAELPFGVKKGQKWVDVSITQGTLVAYADLLPVYATLVSPGAGGVPVEGHDPVKDSTTPMGTFTITFKDRAATMAPMKPAGDRSFWIADVPFTQYFDAPFALHAAFWHERFGEPTSAGCVNLAPIDAEVLFGWTDPPVPDEWQGATGAGAPENGPSTVVVVRR